MNLQHRSLFTPFYVTNHLNMARYVLIDVAILVYKHNKPLQFLPSPIRIPPSKK